MQYSKIDEYSSGSQRIWSGKENRRKWRDVQKTETLNLRTNDNAQYYIYVALNKRKVTTAYNLEALTKITPEMNDDVAVSAT